VQFHHHSEQRVIIQPRRFLADELRKFARVRVVPGSPRWFGPGAAGHIRLSLATTSSILDEALTRIEAAWTEITG
jgi:bifunctional pyridoxal-dependent enzyme with beta-cystathionase and maltose regulon repressor activities